MPDSPCSFKITLQKKKESTSEVQSSDVDSFFCTFQTSFLFNSLKQDDSESCQACWWRKYWIQNPVTGITKFCHLKRSALFFDPKSYTSLPQMFNRLESKLNFPVGSKTAKNSFLFSTVNSLNSVCTCSHQSEGKVRAKWGQREGKVRFTYSCSLFALTLPTFKGLFT